jgi:LmbE family N-acetylglucosaminyl deacetylase
MEKVKSVVVIVAHPDDETLWAGGEILLHPSWDWFVISLCRKNDTDRASRFYRVLKELNTKGIMGDLDDGPEQTPLDVTVLEEAILNLLPKIHFDRIMTHNPNGEYTRHLRHEETSKAVILLWDERKISADELWTFAYDDGHKTHNTTANANAPVYNQLTKSISLKKYQIITETYGFDTNSWEAKNTPTKEAFWQFSNPADALHWLDNWGVIA